MNKKVIVPIIASIITVLVAGTAFAIFRNRQKENEKIEEYTKVFRRHYAEKIVQFEKENETAKDVDVVFLGDSLTEGYDVKRFYPNYNVLNRGISGDTTIGVETRLGVSVFNAKPKVTAMLIGANNINTMFDNYENILISFKENAPEMKVILLSLTSMTYEWGKGNKTAKANNIRIKEYAEQYDFSFVDLYNPLLDTTTNELKEEYTIDGGHLKEKGYQVVTSVITPVLDSLLK